MPYIRSEDRSQFETLVLELKPCNAGELNYCITKLIDDFIDYRGKSYSSINEAVGVLECAKLELYRRVAAPYEDTKIKDNGDVYNKVNL